MDGTESLSPERGMGLNSKRKEEEWSRLAIHSKDMPYGWDFQKALGLTLTSTAIARAGVKIFILTYNVLCQLLKTKRLSIFHFQFLDLGKPHFLMGKKFRRKKSIC